MLQQEGSAGILARGRQVLKKLAGRYGPPAPLKGG
jgi:hypothetical protein